MPDFLRAATPGRSTAGDVVATVAAPFPLVPARQAVLARTAEARQAKRGKPGGVFHWTGATPAFTGACREIDGLAWEAVQVWLAPGGELAAAVVPTPWGLIVATSP